jgi:hypothetical protein
MKRQYCFDPPLLLVRQQWRREGVENREREVELRHRVQIGTDFKGQKIDVTRPRNKGMDALAGNKLLLSDQEAKEAPHSEGKQQRMRKLRKAWQKNKKEGTAFLAANRKRRRQDLAQRPPVQGDQRRYGQDAQGNRYG